MDRDGAYLNVWSQIHGDYLLGKKPDDYARDIALSFVY